MPAPKSVPSVVSRQLKCLYRVFSFARASWPLPSTCVAQKSARDSGRVHLQNRVLPVCNSFSWLFPQFLDDLMTLNSGHQSLRVRIFLSILIDWLSTPWAHPHTERVVSFLPPSVSTSLVSAFCGTFFSAPDGFVLVWWVTCRRRTWKGALQTSCITNTGHKESSWKEHLTYI